MQEASENISQASTVNQEVAQNISGVRDTADQITNRCLEVREYTHELNKLTKVMEQSIKHVDVGTPLFDIGMVKTAHLNWKIQLEAVLEGRTKIQADNVPDHHSCVFGKWYDNAQGEFTNNPLFKEIAVHHKAVHGTVKEVVSLYNKNKKKAAQTKLADFEAARHELFRLLDELYVS